MITTQKFLGLAAAVTIGTLLGCANEFTAPVVPGRVLTSLEMTPPAFRMAAIAGLKTGRLEVRAEDQYGVPMLAGIGSFSISSSDADVVTVADAQYWTSQSNGVLDDSWISAYVTAIAPGEAVISASWTIGGVTKTARSTITVESTEGWSLKVDPAVLTVPAGSTVRVQAAVVDETGNIRMKDHAAFAFTSDRDDVVALSEDEWCFQWVCEAHINVLGVVPGEATITARVAGFSATTSVTVVP